MTREKAASLWPIVKAFGEGRTVQYQIHASGEWKDCYSPDWFEFDNYRIKPEPKLRPWKPEEIPVGALLRSKDQKRHSE